MKYSITETDLRLIIKRVQLDNIQLYDLDNAYPQRIEYIIAGSPRAKQCTEEYKKFIIGGGFKNKDFYKAVINKKGLTADKLLRKNARDFSKLKGFAIHVLYNGLGQIVSVSPVWFKEFRLPIPDEQGNIKKILHHPEWDSRAYGRSFKKELITEYDLYNPNPEIVIEQMINTKGGIENYKGQILYYSENDFCYPLSSVDPVLEDVICDNETKQFRLANTMNGFMASHILVTDAFADDKALGNFKEGLKKFQGARNAMKILHVEKILKEQTVDIKKFDIQSGDKLFEYSEKAVKENIRIAFSAPPVLVGDLVAGKQGTAQEMRDAYLSYNAKTYDDRLIFTETYSELFSHWASEEQINPEKDYSIVNLTFDTGNENITLAEKLGVGGTQAYINLLISAATPQQKINSMVTLFGIDPLVAAANVNGTPLPTNE